MCVKIVTNVDTPEGWAAASAVSWSKPNSIYYTVHGLRLPCGAMPKKLLSLVHKYGYIWRRRQEPWGTGSQQWHFMSNVLELLDIV